MSSSWASTSVIVRFIFWTERATPAFMVTRLATLAFRLMSAWRLSTSSSMRPTERFGTFSRTSGGVEGEAEDAPPPLVLLLLPPAPAPALDEVGAWDGAVDAAIGAEVARTVESAT